MKALAVISQPSPQDEILARLALPRFVETALKVIVVSSVVIVFAGAVLGDDEDGLRNVTPIILPIFVPWLLWMTGALRSRRVLAALVLGTSAAIGVAILVEDALAEGTTEILTDLTIVMWILFVFAPRRELVAVVVGSYATFMWLSLTWGDYIDWILQMVVLTVSWVALLGVRAGAVQIARAQQRLAQAQAADARRQIARDVHDVVAHTLAVTMLHLTAARMAVNRGANDDAAEALDEAERQGLASLADVRRVLQVLDEQEDTPPDLGRIPALVDKYRSAGLPVVLTVDGPVEAVTAAAGTTVYRVVQEALANAARHGHGPATVDLHVDPCDPSVLGDRGVVELVVTNPMRPGEGQSPPPGNGIRGMYERVEAVGGRITVGGVGEWRVQARVPIDHVVRPDMPGAMEARSDDPSAVGG